MGAYNRLAEAVAETYLKQHTILHVGDIIEGMMGQQKACYVTINSAPGNRQRALIGSVLPEQRTLAEEIVANTIKAVDGPAGKISRAELPTLKIYSGSGHRADKN